MAVHTTKIVTDKHLAYRSLQLAQQMSLPIVKVQHHHAHAVACLAEHHWPRHAGDVIALILDDIHINHRVTLPVKDNQLDMITFWQQWLDWQVADVWRAWAFHDALAKGLAELAAFHAQLRKISTIVCSGGVLHNRLLRQRLQFWLTDFELLLPMQLPTGDGSIAFGQALIVAAKLA